jgi:hypothetical protein
MGATVHTAGFRGGNPPFMLPQSLTRSIAVSAYSIARQHIDAALSEAGATGVDAEALLRAFLSTFAERYRDLKGPDDLRAVLQFQLENAQGDEDYMFMRP